MSATVAWISTTPVKGTRLHQRDDVWVTEDGIPGDRAFFVAHEGGAMVSITRLGPLAAVVADHDADAGTLALRFPDGREVVGPVDLGEPDDVGFAGLRMRPRPLNGAFAAALSEHCGTPLRLYAAPPERPGVDRGRLGAVTLLSVASLERLREQAGEPDPVDGRRFRMTFGVEGLEPHEEDRWIGREVRVGDALVRVAGNVGRCAATTRQPDTGVVDFKTLHHLRGYREDIETTEPLPFGVHAMVVGPGRVRVGDAVALAT
ncbi:MAG TPA: MOSC domain-containing protein [Solirubrobacteraceae bacterium]|nr:MOSC domain-containing protein [Solirubrobacteraceae bacterium]